MLLPKRVKHRRQFRGSMAGKATRGNKITNGEFGIVATEPCWIKSNQIEAARVAMTRYIKRGGKVFIKIFPDKPVTGKPIGVRMGKGKGNLECWVAVVKPGRVMFEISGVAEETAREALFTYGLFDFSNVVFFLSAIVAFLFLTVRVLEKRRWG